MSPRQNGEYLTLIIFIPSMQEENMNNTIQTLNGHIHHKKEREIRV
jgi:hypothetical protein